MAEVLTSRTINTSLPSEVTVIYSSVNYNNLIYIFTNSGIYTYDIVNNIYTKVSTKIFSHKIHQYENRYFFANASNDGSYSTTNYIGISISELNMETFDYSTLNSTGVSKTFSYLGTYKALGVYMTYNNGSFYIKSCGLHGSGTSYCSIYATYNISNNSFNTPTFNYIRSNLQNEKTQIDGTTYAISLFNPADSKYVTGGLYDNLTLKVGFSSDEYGGGFQKDGNFYIIQNGVTNIRFININTLETNLLDITVPNDIINVNYFNNRGICFGKEHIAVLEFIDYNLTYTIKSNSGEEIYSQIIGQSPITKVMFNYSSGDRAGYNLTTLSGHSVGTFSIEIPNDKKLLGFSPTPNSTRAFFPINMEVNVSIYEDYSFYAVFLTYRPPTTTFNIELYKNSSEANRVDKNRYLTPVGGILGALREESSITKPVITFESLDIPVFNYVYIPIFNRYYFVNDITSVKYKLWQISMSVDPLMTYKDAIMQCVGFIDRNEHEFNAEIIDKKRAIEQGRTMEVDSVTNELFTGVEGTFSLSALNATAVNVE